MTESSTPTTTSPYAPEADTAPDHSGRNRLVINLLLVSAFVVMLNETIMGVALPRLMEDLRIDASTGQWLTTAFMLTMAVVIPITGFLLQRFTTRQIFMAAMGLFTIGTLVSAFAPGFGVLLIGRVIQASGTAIMMPLLMTTVMTLVPPRERGKTMGNIAIVMSVAPAIGPAISGLILNVLDWRWLFGVVAPIAIAALVLGAMRIQNVTETRAVKIDVLSVILSAFGFGSLIYGLSSIGEAAAGHALVAPWMPLTFGAVMLTLFVVRQLMLQRDDRALLDLRTFTSSGFSISLGLMAVMMMAMFGSIIVLPIYMQSAIGLEPLMSGLLLLPGGLLMGLMGPFVGRLFDRVGPRPLLIPGTIIVSASLWLGALLIGMGTGPWGLLAVHLLLSLGLSLTFTPLFTTSLGSLKPHLYSYGSATIGTIQQLAGAAGTAIAITLLTATSASALVQGADAAAAVTAGVQSAFIAGAAISLLAIVAAVFVKKPASEFGAEGMPAAH